MKKINLLIISLLIFTQSFGQEVNQLDANGERTGSWKKYYSNKKLRYEGAFENGKEVGVFKFYSIQSSKFPVVTKTYTPGVVETKVQFFSKNGIIESEGMMMDKKRIGTWVYYHKNGLTVMIEETYQNGELHGTYKLYYINEQLTKFANYENGKLHGNFKQYAHTGVLTDDLNYVEGFLDGEATYFEPSGKIKQKGFYKKDLKVGEWEFYENGSLVTTKEMKSQEKKKE